MRNLIRTIPNRPSPRPQFVTEFAPYQKLQISDRPIDQSALPWAISRFAFKFHKLISIFALKGRSASHLLQFSSCFHSVMRVEILDKILQSFVLRISKALKFSIIVKH